MNNIVTLRNVYGKEKAHCFINPLKQANGSNYPFVKRVRQVDASGDTEMILSEAEINSPDSNYFIKEDERIEIYDGKTFDLDNPLERNIWTCIKDSFLIAPERDSKDSKGNLLIDGGPKRYGQAEFYVERLGVESEKRIERIKLVTKAFTYIEQDSAKGRLTKTRLLGKSMRNAPDSDVQDYLYQRAEKDPMVVIDLYTGSDTALKLLLIDAKEQRVINLQSGVWMYGDVRLGTTDESILLFLKIPANKTIYEGITLETYPDLQKLSLKETVEEKAEDKAEEKVEDKAEEKVEKTEKKKSNK